jgi:hypothetical protein
MQAVAGKVNKQLTRPTSRRADFPPAKPYICHPPTLIRPNGVAKTRPFPLRAAAVYFVYFEKWRKARVGCERTREPALCAFLMMIVLLLPITACRANPLVPNHDTVGCNYCCWPRVYLGNACAPRMTNFTVCQQPSRLTSSVVFDVGRLLRQWDPHITVESVYQSKCTHAHVYLSRHAAQKRMACFVYLVRLALSQTWPSAQRLLLYAWPGADDTPRRPEAGGPRRDASETFSRRPTRLRIPLAYLPC